MPDHDLPADGAAAPGDAPTGARTEPVADEEHAHVDAEPEAAAPVADEVLLAAVDLARGALLEVTAPETVGSVIGHSVDGERVLSLHFAADLSGYPGWHWSVTLARVEEADPTVLETELLPGEQSLLAPEWVPWSERLAEYRAAQAAAAAGADGDAEAEDAGVDADESADDFADDDEGDDAFDGIDIDALDGDDDSEDEDEDDASDDDASDEDDARDGDGAAGGADAPNGEVPDGDDGSPAGETPDASRS
ncbi:DUF3027 domain-containing protein [Agromyces sp. SYSU T0242]|uniref:DUF3027 domain-containing protein n=1 Tax=Agromyces litoreus TaxID=3158561 RepID=UPI003398C73B